MHTVVTTYVELLLSAAYSNPMWPRASEMLFNDEYFWTAS